MPKVFIAGALLPTGGAYMAYHLGRLLARDFGYELVDVGIYKVDRRIFRYDTPIRTVSVAQMEKNITGEDVLIVNPLYSKFLFGLRLPGRKIMYIQDFRTFELLDCHCDLYVAVSSAVGKYVHALYGIKAPIIPPFIQLNRMPKAIPWRKRPKDSAIVYMKSKTPEHEWLLKELIRKIPALEKATVLEGRDMPHEEFLRRLGEVRYLINMTLAEGFGLVPLEAMAMGTLVTGVDGLAGRDYLQPNKNCMVGSIKNLRALPDIVAKAFGNEDAAARCAKAGIETAQRYGHANFKRAWLKQFSTLLKEKPHD